ncbi:MAG: hypothetical protein RLZ98_656 [Pseudomonadota bacterium]|jgi:hypothetical protein
MRPRFWLSALLVAAAFATGPGASQSQADDGFKLPVYDNPLHEGRLMRGSRNIRAAWFSDPMTDYAHHALGGEAEPRTLVVSTDKRVVLRLTLPADSVFEDREPRIVDVDGDGTDEIVVIRSYITKGSVLAIAAVGQTGLGIVAETEPSGMPFEWLNPAGFGDFDGDGKPDIAVVRRPHDLGQLEIYTLRGRRLERILTVDDVSNHRQGNRDTHLSLVQDFDGDGVVDLAIPTFDRHILQILSFKGRRVRDLDRIYLNARASENFSFVTRRGQEMMAIGIGGGRKQYVRLR